MFYKEFIISLKNTVTFLLFEPILIKLLINVATLIHLNQRIIQ